MGRDKKPLPEPVLSGDIFVFAGLSKRDIDFLSMYFFDCRSQTEIGHYYGISKQSVYGIIKRCLRDLERAGIPLPKQVCGDAKGHKIRMDPYLMDRLFQHRVNDEDD